MYHLGLILRRRALEVRAQLFRSLGDLSRLRVLEALRDGPLSGRRRRGAGQTEPVEFLDAPGVPRGMRARALGTRGQVHELELADKRVLTLMEHAEDFKWGR